MYTECERAAIRLALRQRAKAAIVRSFGAQGNRKLRLSLESSGYTELHDYMNRLAVHYRRDKDGKVQFLKL